MQEGCTEESKAESPQKPHLTTPQTCLVQRYLQASIPTRHGPANLWGSTALIALH